MLQPRSRLRLSLLALAFAGCAHASATAGPELGPEAYLERELISQRDGEVNVRTDDAGMLFHADFSPADRSPLRIPFDRLKQFCEDHGGRFVSDAPARRTAASLAASRAPNDVAATLADADQRAIFGSFRCESSGTTWTAHIEPNALISTEVASQWRLQLFLKAFVGSELPRPIAAQGSPPPSAAGPAVSPSDLGPAPTKPGSIESSPLDPQPLHPPALSDSLLADPRPFGIDMGTDSPDLFAIKLHVDPDQDRCPAGSPAAGSGKHSCWDKPGGSEALQLRAHFVDLGSGPVIAEFSLRYPAASIGWLERSMVNAWGAPDPHGDSPASHRWSWLHTVIELSSQGGETLVQVTHNPTLARARLAAADPARSSRAATPIANPWQIQLGYEPAQLALAKLQAAGFSLAADGCSDLAVTSAPIRSRVCTLRGGTLDGLRSASAIIVDLGDGRPRLAKLEYVLDTRVLDKTVHELTVQYGAPLPIGKQASQWWTGPVGIEAVPSASDKSFTLRYFHGRLLQLHDDLLERLKR